METTWIGEAGEVIIRLIEAGGDKAIAALLWYLAYLIIRIIVIGGVICLVIHTICRGVMRSLAFYNNSKLQRVSLLSEEVSKRWEGSFKGALEHLEDAVNQFESHLEKLAPTPETSSAKTTEEQEKTGVEKSE